MAPFAKDSSLIESIYKSIIANEVEKMKEKDPFKYSLKHTLPMKTSVKLSSKGEDIVFDLLLQKLVFLENSCTISFDDCKGH